MQKDFLVLYSIQAPRHPISSQVLLSFCPLLNLSFEMFPQFYYDTSQLTQYFCSRKCSTSQILCMLELSLYIYIYGEIHVHKQGSPVQVQTPTCWKLIGHSMTIPLHVSSSSILQPLSSHCILIPARKNLGARFKELLF